jgi:hypothetical protein
MTAQLQTDEKNNTSLFAFCSYKWLGQTMETIFFSAREDTIWA